MPNNFLLVNMLKKVANQLFGIAPLKALSFEKIFQTAQGPVEMPETGSHILKCEEGEINYLRKIDTIGTFYIRNAQGKERFIAEAYTKAPDRKIYSAADSAIVGSAGIIYHLQTRAAISETLEDWTASPKNNRLFSAWHLTPPEHINGIAFSLASIGADGGYYHFFHEVLPKLYLSRELLCKANYLLMPGEESAWKKKWLDTINFKLPPIIWLNNSSHYSFNQILFTSRVVTDQQPNAWGVNAIRENLFKFSSMVEKNELQNRVIWVSRKGNFNRDFLWEDLILKSYPRIEAVDFSVLSASETIKICQESSVIIGPHGAGFSNILFCRPNTEILEIFPDEELLPLYGRLANICDLRHHAITLDFNDSNGNSGLAKFEKYLKKYVD